MKMKPNLGPLLIPVILIACLILAVMSGGILRFVFVAIGSVLGGLMIAGFFTVVLSDKEDARLLGTGIAVLVPVMLALWFLLGTGWLMFFLPYTGVLTVVLFLLEARRRATEPQNPAKK